MDPLAFLNRVIAKNEESEDPIEDEFINQAIGTWLRHGEPIQRRGSVLACLARARGLQEQARAHLEPVASDEEIQRSGAAPSDPVTAVLANRLYDDLEAEAAELRKQLFDGKPEIPFPNWDDAFDWLRQEEANSVRPPGYLEMCDEYEKKIKSLCKEYVNRTGGMWILEFPCGPLAYFPSSKSGHHGICRMAVDPYQKRLWALWRFVSEKANLTGLGEPSLLAFVLSGHRSWPKVSLNVTAVRWPEGIRFTTIKIPNPSPSWQDLEYVYSRLRESREHKKALTKTNRALVAAIGEVGDFPDRRKGRMEYWENVAAKVSEALGLVDFTGIIARKRFDRLPKEIRENLPPGRKREQPTLPREGQPAQGV